MSSYALTPLVFIFLGVLAAGTTYFTIQRTIDVRWSGLLSTILWFVWGLAAFRVVTVTTSGELVAHNWAPLGYVGIAVALIMALDWIGVVLEEADVEVNL